MAVPRDLVKAQAGPFDYLISIHRFHRPKEFLVYPIAQSQSPPEIDIPLLPGDPDVPLKLQKVFNQAYDSGPYQKEMAYGKDAIVPRLKPEQAKWAMALLRPRERRTR